MHRRDLEGVKTREFYEKLSDVIELPKVGRAWASLISMRAYRFQISSQKKVESLLGNLVESVVGIGVP